jgi:ketopantoate reductase
VRDGARLGVPTPLNSALAALVAALDASAAQRIEAEGTG